MEDKNLRRSLLTALQWASLRSLPEQNDREAWVCALALVTKHDGTKGYVALKKDKDGGNKVVKDFGSISTIAEIIEIYPYQYLDGSQMPDFRGAKKEEKIKWLMANGVNENFEEMSVKEINKMILNVATQQQLKN